MQTPKYKRSKKAIWYVSLFFFFSFIFLAFFANRFVEPVLRDRLHTLIIRGSDSLYYYSLEKLSVNILGGSVEVENLHIRVDSNRYFKMLKENALPSLTMQLHLLKGKIKGLGVLSLIIQKKINISEVVSQEADIKLSRHLKKDSTEHTNVSPLWKAIEPEIKSISIDKINLDGVKLLYRNADTSESVKLQFDRCEAVFNDILIDSASANDTSRMGFAKNLSMQFYDLKFRTPDSTYKMKAELISYSTVNKVLQVNQFKLQPTLEDEDFFKYASIRKSRYLVEFKELKFTNLLLDRFIHKNRIIADSVLIHQPEVSIDNDKTLPPDLESKIGNYPHQQLLKAEPVIIIKGMRILDGTFAYTEKSEKTYKKGKLVIDHMNAFFSNLTNSATQIKKNPLSTATINAKLFESSPVSATFTFYLDSTEGEFDVWGQINNVNAIQLNAVTEPLANIKLTSLDVHSLKFQMQGDDYSTRGKVEMRYDDLAIILRKTDEETGATKTKKFLTKIINKVIVYPSNPSGGQERVANDVIYARISSKSFFGVIWKTIFFGMQTIMMKTGSYQ